MSTRFVFTALLSAVLLSSYSSAMAADIRPEVARPLDEARVIANAYGGAKDKIRIEAKLNQAASVPNLNKDEQDKIRFITSYALGRISNPSTFAGWDQRGAPQSDGAPVNSLNPMGTQQSPSTGNMVQVGPR